jgi:hypothetical protein
MAGRTLPFMLERIRKCQRCGSEVFSSPIAYLENPFCVDCLSPKRGSQGEGEIELVESGHYVQIKRVSRTLR